MNRALRFLPPLRSLRHHDPRLAARARLARRRPLASLQPATRTRPRGAGLDAPAPFVGKIREHFAEALRTAWAGARQVDAAPMSPEVAAARRELIAAQMIDSWRVALPAIAAAQARLAALQNGALAI
jgi:hypothetical protein